MHNFLLWLGGIFAVALPALLIYLSVTTATGHKKLNYKFVMSVLIVVFLSTVINLFLENNCTGYGDYFKKLGNLSSGNDVFFGTGLLGNILGLALRALLGLNGAKITSVLLLALFVMLICGITMANITSTFKKPVDKIKVANEQMISRAKKRREEKAEQQNESDAPQQISFDDEVIDIPLEGASANKKNSDEKADRLKYAVTNMNNLSHKSTSASTDNNTGFNKDSSQSDFPDDEYIRQAISHGSTNYTAVDFEPNTGLGELDSQEGHDSKTVKVKPVRAHHEKGDISDVHIDIYKTPKSNKKTAEETAALGKAISEEIRQNALSENENGEYIFPPVELLTPARETDDTGIIDELHYNADKLIRTLESFNVKASIVNICRGPSVTRYEIQPAPGVKISRITNLADDIALNLAAIGVRIEAPIPGKAAVGIEVPNKTVSMVSMRELIESDTFTGAKSRLSCVIGRDISGDIMAIDLAKLPHLLIAGTTGSGKSVCVNSILLSILYKAKPDEVKLILIDPKMVEFSKYKSIPHLLIPVVSDPKKAAGALNWAVNEMLERYKAFSECGVRDIHGYNKLVNNNIERIREAEENGEEAPDFQPSTRMPQIVIAIDELSDLMMAAPKEVEDSIFRLAQMARAAGMHLVVATQRPSTDVITGVIKANIPSRIALKVSSNVDSRTILDAGGAEKLIGKGDMLCSPVGVSKPVRVQGGFASDEEIENITEFIKNQSKAEYNEDVIEQIDQIAEKPLSGDKKGSDAFADSDSDTDPLTEDAIKCVVEAGEASVSLLQRRLKVGYARAGRLVDDLEDMGIVGPHEGSKKRKVLMTYQQWLERTGNIG
ncbi:MAG: DNA translocase FtsK [Clostridiales bacterium]|nr:DNA translocase FtsK [Clostridiales bacterium]